MSATYNVVTIGGSEYDVYADVPTADEYLEAESWATAWRAETDEDQKARALVTATRTLDKLPWAGSKSDPDQPLEWPRDGTGIDIVEDGVIPQRIIDATCVLAGQILAGVDVTGTASTTASSVKRQKAGSVEIEYFSNFEISGTRLPLEAWELIAPLLGGSIATAGSVAFGTDECSRFRAGYEPSGPL